MSEPQFFRALALADLVEATPCAVVIADQSLMLCRIDGTVYALDNRCSHADEPLACGRVRHGWIACPAHGARFDLATGEAVGPPAIEPIGTYPVRITDGMIEVEL